LRSIFSDVLVHRTIGQIETGFELAPYQQFVIYNIFAWIIVKLNYAGSILFMMQARKMGKPRCCPGWGCTAIFGWRSPEIYVGATKKHKRKRFGNRLALSIKVCYCARLDFVIKRAKLCSSKRNLEFSFLVVILNLDSLNPSRRSLMNITRTKMTIREVLESAMGARINHWFILYHRRIQFEIRAN
jgi:hypothetical protein